VKKEVWDCALSWCYSQFFYRQISGCLCTCSPPGQILWKSLVNVAADNSMRRAAIYARLSEDTCREWRGWTTLWPRASSPHFSSSQNKCRSESGMEIYISSIALCISYHKLQCTCSVIASACCVTNLIGPFKFPRI
jgi:hypothetical protein